VKDQIDHSLVGGYGGYWNWCISPNPAPPREENFAVKRAVFRTFQRTMLEVRLFRVGTSFALQDISG
jgi:hypothetical protein